MLFMYFQLTGRISSLSVIIICIDEFMTAVLEFQECIHSLPVTNIKYFLSFILVCHFLVGDYLLLYVLLA